MNHSKENKQEHQHMMHSEEVGQTSHHSHQQEHPHEEGVHANHHSDHHDHHHVGGSDVSHHSHHTHDAHQHHQGHDHDMMEHGGHMMHMGDMNTKLKVAVAVMIPLLAISPIAGFTLLRFPGVELVQLILGSIIFFYSGTPFFNGARGELQAKKPAMMTLISMGIIVSYLYSVYATILALLGQESMNFWFELSTLIVIMLIGHIIEMKAVMGAGDALKDLASLIPKKAHLKDGTDVAVEDLQIGDFLLVKENEKIPADGKILSVAHIDESMITGESRAVKKEAGDRVFGGSLNQNTPFEMEVTSLGKDSFLAQVTEMVRQAQNQKSKLENMADRVASWLFYAALIVGILAFIYWTMTANLAFALMMAVSVFVIACPHALGLAIPLVVARLTTISSKNGLLVQNRTALEQVNQIRFALMDKTGTLTDGKFQVRHSQDLVEGADALAKMAALEVLSTHPIALSIVEAAGPLFYQAERVENIPGSGIRGVLDGRIYEIMSYKGLQEIGLSVDQDVIAPYLDLGLTLSFLVTDHVVLGFVALGDQIKEDAKYFVAGLKAQGISPVMLTGDNPATAQKVAIQLGIEDYRAELKPEDKAKLVKDYQARGAVLFIGDGVNDSPALATADLGFAIGAGTSVAIHSADVVLVQSNPSAVLDMLSIAKTTIRKMRQNLWFGAGYNIIAIPLAAGILYPSMGIMVDPLLAAVLMSLSTVIVAINAMGLRYGKP
ncbi:copper-translocating P-type ATPase [Streptococcus suis]|uniref:P-type Cu(+) transporter n=1 Tax=Streptococcus suis D12 TaxID=1004952 RepID=G7SGU8_STRSU|nr:copper-translocating P-type ATPase [Streptococcus suis]AER18963.1 copper-potassium transporting ATPase B [Streptococcus suis D12]MCQ9223697.1 copper-translocating P-type ATPase [Streptococcus suis]MCQ9230379.1 copper-translocating P-type ATPase [Streptococcus suis]MDW8649432.1 copper-translocating P-type ATPase [Streptococcus suis]UUM22602.1 copper-translocating P-type ATPase [Streptococcus suis]